MAVAVAALGALTSGCASTLAGLPVVGLPEGTPERPAMQADYPAVHDTPSPRPQTPLNEAEQQKLEKELIAARERQAARADAVAKTEAEPARKPEASRKKGKSVNPAGTEATGTSRNP